MSTGAGFEILCQKRGTQKQEVSVFFWGGIENRTFLDLLFHPFSLFVYMLFRCRCLLHTLPLSWLWCACCGHFRSASADPNNSWPARTTLLHAHRHTHTYTHTKFFLLASCVFCQLNFSLYTISTLLPFLSTIFFSSSKYTFNNYSLAFAEQFSIRKNFNYA